MKNLQFPIIYSQYKFFTKMKKKKIYKLTKSKLSKKAIKSGIKQNTFAYSALSSEQSWTGKKKKTKHLNSKWPMVLIFNIGVTELVKLFNYKTQANINNIF